jgi:ribosomal protein L29
MAKKEKEFNYAQADVNELQARLDKTQSELFKTRFRVASAPVSNTMQIRKLRREVARLFTFINQKSVNVEKAPVAAKAPVAKAPAAKAPAAKASSKTPVAAGAKAKGK